MADLLIKAVFLVLFFGVMVGIGIYCRRHVTDVNGFVLGGRSVGPWLTAFAYGTSYFSAVVFVGYAGQFGWKYGLAATWAGIGNAILGSLLAWVVLGRRTRVMSQHLDSATMPEFFGRRFGSRALKLCASAIIFIFLIPYTASLYNGLSRLFGMAFSIDYSVCVVVMAALTAVYVIAGGYMATAINDFIQGIIMLAGIAAVIFAVLQSQGGFLAALEKLARVQGESPIPGVYASFFGPDPVNLLGVVILTSLGTWGLPQMVQKFYAIKSEAAISKGTVISTVFALVVSGGCYFLGGFGRLFGERVDIAADGFDAVIPAMLSGLPTLLIAVVVILVLSASMSTLSSLVLTSSSTLTLDFIRGNLIREMDEKRQVQWMRGPGVRGGGPGPGGGREAAGAVDAGPDCGVHPYFGGAGPYPVPLQRHLHRPADGGLLGGAGRGLPGPLPLRPVLEGNHRRRLLGQLPLFHRGDAGQYLLAGAVPCPAPIPH